MRQKLVTNLIGMVSTKSIKMDSNSNILAEKPFEEGPLEEKKTRKKIDDFVIGNQFLFAPSILLPNNGKDDGLKIPQEIK